MKRKAITKATPKESLQDKAADLAAQLRVQAQQAHLDERAAELADRAAELAERIRRSDAYRAAQAKGAMIAATTRQKVHESHLDERAAELADRVRESQAAEKARETSDRTLERVGDWLSHGRTGEKLHLQPAKRGFPGWLVALLGLAAGFAVGMLAAPKRGDELRADLVGSASRLASRTPVGGMGGDTLETTGPGPQEAVLPPSADAQKPLADRVRTALGQDPRTRDLPKLNVNVVEGTVFVRGAVPDDFDEASLRSVVESVDGVTDVDLQVSVGT